MKEFRSPKDVKRRNKQAYSRIQELERGSFIVRPNQYWDGAETGIFIQNNGPLKIRVLIESTKKGK